MARLRSLSLPQRMVLVVAAAALLAGGWLWWYLADTAPSETWFAYAPNTGETFTDEYALVREHGPEHLAVGAALVVLWAVGSVWLLGGPRRDHESGPGHEV